MKKQTTAILTREIISPKSSIAKILKNYPETAVVFLHYNLHCAGCPMAEPETLSDVSDLHGVDVEKLIGDLNKVINKKNK